MDWSIIPSRLLIAEFEFDSKKTATFETGPRVSYVFTVDLESETITQLWENRSTMELQTVWFYTAGMCERMSKAFADFRKNNRVMTRDRRNFQNVWTPPTVPVRLSDRHWSTTNDSMKIQYSHVNQSTPKSFSFNKTHIKKSLNPFNASTSASNRNIERILRRNWVRTFADSFRRKKSL